MKQLQKENLYLNKMLKNYPSDVADSLQYEANSYIYYYGDHFKSPNNFKITNIIKRRVYTFYNLIYFLKCKFKANRFIQNRKIVLCNAYFEFSNYLKPSLNVFNVPWSYDCKNLIFPDRKLSNVILKIKNIFNEKSLNKILSSSFLLLVSEYKNAFKNFLKKNRINALIVSLDITYFEAMSISCAKELGVPTFLFLHGLPVRYNSIDDNRTDYLLVWGDAIKQNYVKHGVAPDKIIVTGHPIYSKIKEKALKSSLDNILVLSKAMCGTPHSDMVRLMDRSNSLYYLEAIKELLLSVGVLKARLRCHPSEDPSFYKKHLSENFYTFDLLTTNESLKESTLVLGPGSTMIFDALVSGVNYILFEPIYLGKSLTGFEIVPPFDGRHFISTTNNVESFNLNLNPANNINWNLINDYTGKDFSLDRFFQLINNIK